MATNEIKAILKNQDVASNETMEVALGDSFVVGIYPRSVIELEQCIFFIGKSEKDKALFIIDCASPKKLSEKFDGTIISDEQIKKCPFTTKNRLLLQQIFDFTRPRVLGIDNSFGFGDRLGLATAGHIRSLEGSQFKPILAQQSIRELVRTQRTADEVMDAAVWAVFQEGYKSGFGADADHLKTTEDVDIMVNAGFKMFTIDPGDHVDNLADGYDAATLERKGAELPWKDLGDSLEGAKKRYNAQQIKISDSFTLNVTWTDLLKAFVKYGKAIAHIKKMYDHLKNTHKGYEFEVEVSVDETESVTSPFEHYFFVNELKRLNVEFVSLAPRFIGAFEKGIDYKGDLAVFKNEYLKHLAIVNYFGNFKISLHSGSDKFSVYKVIGSIKGSHTHVKTAGTSYLEALKVLAIKKPSVFREVLDFSRGNYEMEKKSYHVSADIARVKDGAAYADNELAGLFELNDARQVLHVSFGRVLTEKDKSGHFIFKDRILGCLRENEELYDELLVRHFHKHLDPFC
jgi:hypothetical protein